MNHPDQYELSNGSVMVFTTYIDHATAFQSAAFVPAPPKRLRLKPEAWHSGDTHIEAWGIGENVDVRMKYGVFMVMHHDGTETDHTTRYDAHMSLLASGSLSPWEEA